MNNSNARDRNLTISVAHVAGAAFKLTGKWICGRGPALINAGGRVRRTIA
jgi:hypothetical protein